MAKENNTGTQQQPAAQPQAPQPRPCPQDCRQCGVSQQVFCSTKMLFDLSRSLQALRDQMDELAKDVGTLQDQMKALQGQDGELSIPFEE